MRLDMKVQKIPREKGLITESALVTKDPWEVHTLNMIPQVATVAADLATYCAFVAARAIFQIFHYVGVKLPLSPSCSKPACLPCKEVSTVLFVKPLLGNVSFKTRMLCGFYQCAYSRSF